METFTEQIDLPGVGQVTAEGVVTRGYGGEVNSKVAQRASHASGESLTSDELLALNRHLKDTL